MTVRCPGCGSVLAAAPEEADGRAACRRLFEETVRGLREEAGPDPRVARTAALADAAYAAQHPDDREPDRLSAALAELAGTDEGAALPADAAADPGATPPAPPSAWTTTVADVAADLDVIDLTVLVEAWAATVVADWRTAGRATTPSAVNTERS